MSEPLQFNAPFNLGAQLEARVAHPVTEHKVFLMQDDRTWTYRQLRDEAVRTAHFLRRRLEPTSEGNAGHVAMLLENHFELVSLLFGCAYSGYTLFGINTGLRGDTLAGVVNQSRARMLIVDERGRSLQKLQGTCRRSKWHRPRCSSNARSTRSRTWAPSSTCREEWAGGPLVWCSFARGRSGLRLWKVAEAGGLQAQRIVHLLGHLLLELTPMGEHAPRLALGLRAV